MLAARCGSVLFAISLIVAVDSTAKCRAEDPAKIAGELRWQRLADLPNELGVAGPFVGVHKGVLVVAGGANFPQPVWETQKVWTDEVWTLKLAESNAKWTSGGRLPRALAYGASASTDLGIVCVGGNDQHRLYADAFLLKWDVGRNELISTPLPSLPVPFAYGQATAIGNVVYVACGQTDAQLGSASNALWSLDVSALEQEQLSWKKLSQFPGQSRAFNITACQNNGETDCVYVLGGRFQSGTETRFLKDAWEFNPEKNIWRQLADLPHSVTAGTGIGFGKNELIVLGGDDGSLFTRTEELKDSHPGFRKEALRYDTVSNTWTVAGSTPMNQVTTIPVKWNESVIVATGEIRPRVRTPAVWIIEQSVPRAAEKADER